MFKKTKSFSSFSPMIVPVSENETEGEFLQRWKKFDALPKDVKSKLSSKETLEEIKNIKQIFNLEPLQIAGVSRLVRSYYFRELELGRLPSLLSEKAGIDLSKAQEIAKHITEKIINQKTQSESGVSDKTIVKLPILEALKKYPELGGQKISANNIKLEIFPDPVKPSIKNWIADYRQVIGTGNHGAIEKSNYLFHGENAKKLNSQELQKLSLILKSLDSHISLTINAQDQRVIFPLLEASKYHATSRKPEVEIPKAARPATENDRPAISNKQIARQPNKNDAGNFRFSSPQTLESEKEEKEKLNKDKDRDSRYYQIYPMGISRDGEGEKSRSKTKGNIVNLREDF